MNAGVVARLQELGERLDRLSLRERGLVFVAALVMLLVVTINFLFTPLLAEQQRLQGVLAGKREQMLKLETQLQTLVAEASRDPDAANRARLATLQQQLGTLDAALAEKTAGLVSPPEMTKLVREVLERNRRLELIRVESLAPVALIEEATPGERTRSGQEGKAKPQPATPQAEYMIYRHGMRVQFRGRYADIVDYLKALEGLPWKVFWGQAALEAESYPVSHFTLVLHTLSLRQGWMGV